MKVKLPYRLPDIQEVINHCGFCEAEVYYHLKLQRSRSGFMRKVNSNCYFENYFKMVKAYFLFHHVNKDIRRVSNSGLVISLSKKAREDRREGVFDTFGAACVIDINNLPTLKEMLKGYDKTIHKISGVMVNYRTLESYRSGRITNTSIDKYWSCYKFFINKDFILKTEMPKLIERQKKIQKVKKKIAPQVKKKKTPTDYSYTWRKQSNGTYLVR